MTNSMHGEPGESSVERMARHLMETARQEPSLLGRRHAIMRQQPTETRAFDLAGLGGIGHFDVLQQVEDLTSIAIASAQQAETAFQRACETIRAARRGMAAFGTLGVLGILAGAAAIADNHLRWDVPAAAVQADATPAPAPVPNASPSTPVTYVPPLPVPPASTSVPAAPAYAPAPAPQPFVPPAYRPPATYAAPWPSERVAVVGRRAAPVPPFVVAIRRGINSLLQVPRNF